MLTLSEADRAALLMMFPHLKDGEIDGSRLADRTIDAWYAEDFWNDNHVHDGMDQEDPEMDR